MKCPCEMTKAKCEMTKAKCAAMRMLVFAFTHDSLFMIHYLISNWSSIEFIHKLLRAQMSYTKTREPTDPSEGRARDRVRTQQKKQNRTNRCEERHANIQDKACCKNRRGVCNLTRWSDPTLLRAIRVYVNALPEADELAFILERRLVSEDVYTSANRGGSTRHRRLHQCYLEPPDELRSKLLDLTGSDLHLNTMAIHQATTAGKRILPPKALDPCCEPFLVGIVCGRSKKYVTAEKQGYSKSSEKLLAPERTRKTRATQVADGKGAEVLAYLQDLKKQHCVMPNEPYTVVPYPTILHAHAAYALDIENSHGCDCTVGGRSEYGQYAIAADTKASIAQSSDRRRILRRGNDVACTEIDD
jgi:hypothetical protein